MLSSTYALLKGCTIFWSWKTFLGKCVWYRISQSTFPSGAKKSNMVIMKCIGECLFVLKTGTYSVVYCLRIKLSHTVLFVFIWRGLFGWTKLASLFLGKNGKDHSKNKLWNEIQKYQKKSYLGTPYKHFADIMLLMVFLWFFF